MRGSRIFAVAAVSVLPVSSYGAFTSFNDFSQGPGEPANTTLWGAPGGPGAFGLLKDFATGTNTPVTLTLVTTGGANGTGGPSTEFVAGTNAADIFNGKTVHKFDLQNNVLIIDGVNYTAEHNRLISA